jgi:4-aminobutyrate aminotransferase/4-aminobutyrate aminotransferase/(S)-3-amino-2-methylpropionate transaminase
LAAAHAVIKIIDEEQLCERSASLGDRIKAKLTALQYEVPQIAEVRGLGGIVAVEFCKTGEAKPNADFAKRLQVRALEQGLLLVCGVHSNVVRFLFPLTIQDAVFHEGMTILQDVIKSSAIIEGANKTKAASRV